MSTHDDHNTPAETGSEDSTYVPASVSKRIWAWMGLIYAVLIMFLITYWIATSRFLSGIPALMLFPYLGALSAQGVNNARLCRLGQRGGNLPLLLGSAILIGVAALGCLGLGVRQLAAALLGG